MTLDYATDARRMDELKAGIAVLTKELDDIKAKYADVPDDKYPAGDFILSVKRKSLFNGVLARKVLTKAEYDSICVPKPDPEVARRKLHPSKYAKMVKLSAPTITITRVEDFDD